VQLAAARQRATQNGASLAGVRLDLKQVRKLSFHLLHLFNIIYMSFFVDNRPTIDCPALKMILRSKQQNWKSMRHNCMQRKTMQIAKGAATNHACEFVVSIRSRSLVLFLELSVNKHAMKFRL
jgi:hypothetical protein